LTSDRRGPADVARLLSEGGFGASEFTVLEALGGESERIQTWTASTFASEDINELNLIALEVRADGPARVLPLSTGLEDHLFEHDGQMTKREIRAVTLSALAPRRG